MDFLFSRLVKAKDSVREFNFKKPLSVSMHLFHVNVNDDMGNRIVFRMQKEGVNGWKIVERQLPSWIYEVAPELNEAIEEQLHL